MERNNINRRRFIRMEFPYTIHIYQPQEKAISTYTENISAGGVKVVIKKKLEISSMVDLEIYVKQKPVLCKGRIVWVKEKESNYLEGAAFFDTGIEFNKINEEDRLAIKNCVEEIEKKRRNQEGQ